MNARARRMSAAFLVSAMVAAGSVVLLASCQDRGGGVEGVGKAPMQSVGELEIGVANTPDPPHTGDNALTIVVRDASGKPVRGAAVDAVVSMAAMGAMPRMESRGKIKEVKPGVYGAEAAARYYYQTSAAALTRERAARLAAVLPAPRTRTPQRMDAASARILTRMQQMGW